MSCAFLLCKIYVAMTSFRPYSSNFSNLHELGTSTLYKVQIQMGFHVFYSIKLGWNICTMHTQNAQLQLMYEIIHFIELYFLGRAKNPHTMHRWITEENVSSGVK